MIRYVIKDSKTKKLRSWCLYEKRQDAQNWLDVRAGPNSFLRNKAEGKYGRIYKSAVRSLRVLERCKVVKVAVTELE